MEKQINKILVSRPGYMGDVIVSTPLLKNLRCYYPDANISFLTKTDYAPLLENNPDLDEVISFHPETGMKEVISELRSKKFDLSIDLLANSRTALLSRAIGARRRVGRAGGVRRFCFTDFYSPQNLKADLVDRVLENLRPLGIPTEKYEPRLHLTETEMEWSHIYLRSGGIDFARPVIGIYPGGRLPNKHWSVEKYVETVDQLTENGWQVVLTQMPGEGPNMQRIMDRVDKSVICAQPLPIRRFAALLARMDVFLCNYSGLTHLAAAVGISVVTLFGPDDPQTCFPYDEVSGHKAIYRNMECRPCNSNECLIGTLDCLNEISVDEVLKTIYTYQPEL